MEECERISRLSDLTNEELQADSTIKKSLIVQLEGNREVSREDTITNHVDKLLKRGAVTVTKNLVTVKIANSVGAVNETTLYDLKVFNYLVMRLDTHRAWAMKEKFNDVLVERETGVTQKQLQPTIFDYARALIVLSQR